MIASLRSNRAHLITSLLPLVRACARRLKNTIPAAELDDLVADGALGLIRAVDTFDPSRGMQLRAYASHIVAGAILNGIRYRDPVSERSRALVRRARAERVALANERGCLPSMMEMERRHPGLRRALLAIYQRGASLSLDTLPSVAAINDDKRLDDPAHIVAYNDLLARTSRVLAALPARERHIILWHYVDDLSLHVIAKHLDITPQRVSQLHARTLDRLRHTLA